MPQRKLLLELLIQANEFKCQKNYRGALALYHEAVEQFGENADLFVGIALCHYLLTADPRESRSQHFEEAINWMKKAIALSPNYGYWHHLLGEIYHIGMLDYESAAEECRRAIELNPYDAQGLFNAASLYDSPEQVVTLEEVTNWLERATEGAPWDPDYHFRLGKFYHLAGRSAEAEEEWLKALLCSSRALRLGAVKRIREMLELQEDEDSA